MHVPLPHASQFNAPLAPTQDYSVNNSTIQIHHHRVTQGLRVQTGKVLSKLRQHPLPPLHQWRSQDLFVGTVEKQAI